MIAAAAVVLLFTLQEANAAGKAKPRCGSSDWALEVNSWRSHGNILLVAGIVTDKMRSCALKGTARIAVRYRQGKVAGQLRGNPARWRVSATLKPWSQLVHTWIWRN